MLDASKAFDHVNYCQIFRIVLDSKVWHFYCRLLNKYLNQTLRNKWDNNHFTYFNITNGVKQGRVNSPILFCSYIDGLTNELESNGAGCYSIYVVRK